MVVGDPRLGSARLHSYLLGNGAERRLKLHIFSRGSLGERQLLMMLERMLVLHLLFSLLGPFRFLKAVEYYENYREEQDETADHEADKESEILALLLLLNL